MGSTATRHYTVWQQARYSIKVRSYGDKEQTVRQNQRLKNGLL